MQIRSLNGDEVLALKQALELAAKLVDRPVPLQIDAVQELYNAIVDGDADMAEAKIALGLSFGQLIADKARYEWVRVSDEYGEETCLSPIGVQLICAPISMIQKRIQSGNHADLVELRDETISSISSRMESGEYRPR
ncbi:MAG: DUF3806 domain-containing protein [Pseudomonadota bacterium]